MIYTSMKYKYRYKYNKILQLLLISLLSTLILFTGCARGDGSPVEDKGSFVIPENVEFRQQENLDKYNIDEQDYIKYTEQVNHYKDTAKFAEELLKQQYGELNEDGTVNKDAGQITNNNSIKALRDKSVKEIGEIRTRMVEEATKHLGKKYRHANYLNPNGDSTDCSGFTGWVYMKADLDLYHLSKITGISEGYSLAQAQCYLPLQVNASTKANEPNKKTMGTRFTDASKLKPGDLVCMKAIRRDSKEIDHVGIYVGDNKMIHSTKHGAGIEPGVIYSSIVKDTDESYVYHNTIKWYVNLLD